MQDRLKALLNKLLELWKKYTKKQKTIIFSVLGVLLIMIVMLAYFLGRTNYVYWQTFDDLTKVKAVDEVLTEAGIAHRIGADSTSVYVDSTKTVEANLAVVNSDAMSDGRMTLADLLDNDMSTTNADKLVKNAAYNQGRWASQIEQIVGVDHAEVNYIPIDRTSTILDEKKDIQCSIYLTVNSQFRKDAAEAIAITIANALGNQSLDTVKVIDQYGNLLYDGPEDEDSRNLTNQLQMTQQVYDFYRNRIMSYGLHLDFDYVEAEFFLDIDYNQVEEYFEQYLPAEGQDQGLYGVYERIQSENTGGTGDVPGTDSNDETDYYIATNTGGSSNYDSLKIQYLPSKRVTTTMRGWGVVNTSTSKMALVLKKVQKFTRDDLERLGKLEGTTYEDYIVHNRDWVSIPQEEIPQEFYQAFSDASGIDVNNISIIVYEIPEYIEEESEGTNWNLILTIVLFVIIIGLLVFVVFRVSKPEEVVELEPELSVEKLLATTKENQSLEDIEFDDMSETKRLIDKFVDENPEAVAALLRNWLNDDWG